MKKSSPKVHDVKNIIEKSGVYFVVADQDYDLYNSKILEHMVNDLKKRVVFVSLRNSTDRLNTLLKKNKIDQSKIFFIRAGKQNQSNEKNKVSVKNASSLVDLSLATTTAINSGKFDFVVIDSLTVLLIFNELNATKKFMHFMINKVRDSKVGMVFYGLNDEHTKKMKPLLTQLYDLEINIDK